MQMVACVPYRQRDVAAALLQARNSKGSKTQQINIYIYLYMDVKKEKLDTLQKVCVFHRSDG